MENIINLKYFLGANTSMGFYSYFDGLASNPDDFLWIIKGGPGNGKSGFMKKIATAANEAGYTVEFTYCSGDPGSVDGIYIPKLKTGYVDGTSPHIADVKIAACNSAYLDLGTFYDISAIKAQKETLEQYFSKNKEYYKRAYDFLSAAGNIKKVNTESTLPSVIRRRINGISNRNFKEKRNSTSHVKDLFLSSHTCEGMTVYTETLNSLCKKLYVIDSAIGYGPKTLEILSKGAQSAGYDIIICHDPLLPELYEAIIIPELSIGFINSSSALASIDQFKKIRLDIYANSDDLHMKKAENRKYAKIYNAILNEAYLSLSNAKANHDEIEKLYNPYVDFDGVYALAKKHISSLIR